MNTQQHITGNDLSDALSLLQQLAECGANGSLKTATGSLRLRSGQVVKTTGTIIADLISGLETDWGWRQVPGLPNGDMQAELGMVLLRAQMAA